MHAQHDRGSRTIRFSALPRRIEGLTNDHTELDCSIRYTGDSNGARAIALDNAVIPSVVRAVNNHERLIEACQLALNVLEGEPECRIYSAHAEAVRAALNAAKGES